MRALWPAALLLLTIALPRPACAQAIKGEVSAVMENGFARLVFTLAEDVESQVKVANGIIIVSYRRPIAVNVDKLAANAPGYVSAARRDPDGKAIRIALARKVTVNSIAAAERLFVDLLPEPWAGLPPGLPREVIDDLAKRAREADRKLRQHRVLARQAKMLPIRVRVASQPTFMRYIFDLPELIGVAAHNDKDRLTLTFDALLKFDLADAKATLPPVIASIDSEIDQEAVLVRFAFGGKVDVRTFREDLSYVVDVTPTEAKSQRSEASVRSDELSAFVADLANRKAPPPAAVQAPPTMPAGARLRLRAATPAAANAAGTGRGSAPAARGCRSRPPPPATPAAEPERAPKTEDRAQHVAATPPAAAPAAAASPSPAAAADSAPPAHDGTVDVVVKRQGDGLALSFPFAVPTPAAVFRRADMLWLVFDTEATIGLAAFESDRSRTIKSATLTRRADVAVVRIKLERPRLVSATTDGPAWTIMIGGEVVEPTRPLAISRNIIGPARSSITIAFDEPRGLHRIDDPEAGDKLMVVTALGPSRGFVKNQDFVEFRALASTHGVVVQPLADDVGAELSAGRIVLTRPAGLTLSAIAESAARSANAAYQPHVLDPQSWGFDRQADFAERTSALIRAAAEAPEAKRPIARADLARFYLARELAAEAKAVLDVAISDHAPTAEDPTPLVLRAIANIMLRRPEQALKDLANPAVGNQHDAPLWRALAYAGQSKWSDAREGFRSVGMAMGTLPIELQRVIIKDMLRASLEVGDVTGALKELHELETIGVPRELEPTLSVLTGRVVEALGRIEDALRAYQAAADSWDRPIAAQGAAARAAAAANAGQSHAQRRHRRAGDAHHRLARRRDRGRGDAVAGAPLHRGQPLSRRLPPHAHRARGASQFRADAAHPRRGGGELRRPVPRRPRRRAAGDRCAQPVLRLPRAHPDRPARRRDDPPARRPAGRGRSARPGGRAVAAPGRPPAAGRRPLAGGGAARRHLPDEPQGRPDTGDLADDPLGRPLERAAQSAPAARGARSLGARPPRPGVRGGFQYPGPRSGPAARRHPVGGKALARGG